LGLPTVLTALAVSGIASVTAKRNPLPLLGEVSWSTLALVAALFVMVDAVESIGALHHTERWLRAAASLGPAPGALSTGFVVGVANNVVNNLPLGLLAGNTLRAVHASGLLAAAVLIGVDLGPNLAVTGSLATILWLIALRKEHLNVSFWDFFKVGVVAMPAALLLSLAGAVALQVLFSLR
jgi:arsenical pump membrane protein